MDPPIADPDDDQIVTSSDLVRQFGIWQERAAQRPVYVLHRGRPRFVLTSVAIMEALCASGAAPAMAAGGLDLLLDHLAEIVIRADAQGNIRGASRGARDHFGDLVAPGASATALAGIGSGAMLVESMRRVVASGAADAVDVPSAGRPGRVLALTIRPDADGVALHAQDLNIPHELRQAHAGRDALTRALDATGTAASVRINLRGHIDAPGAALARMTGVAIEALAATRFVTLVEVGARVAVGEAIERVIASGADGALDARLLVNRGEPLPVRIGLAPVREGLGVAGVSAILVPVPPLAR